MSVSSNSRKESTDSYASQQMQNGGDMPGLDQLHRFNQPEGTVGTVEGAQSNDTDFSDDMAEITDSVAENGEPTATETDSLMTGHRTGSASVGGDSYSQPSGVHVDDADWNTTTEDDGTVSTQANEPDRTIGNS